MCLNPKLIRNRRYVGNEKNNWTIPECKDERLLYIQAQCGKCWECRKRKASEWRLRLTEALSTWEGGKFVTLTYSDKELNKLKEKYNNEEQIFIKSIRNWLELDRKYRGKMMKHFLIAEKGQNNTERLHAHGIVWGENPVKHWKYGKAEIGYECSQRTINYLVKYILKPDSKHKEFRPKILASHGIGKGMTEKAKFDNRYRGEKTSTKKRLPNGLKIELPYYIKAKILSIEEREQLRLYKEEKGEKWVNGIKFTKYDSEERIIKYRNERNEYYKRLGYSDTNIEEEFEEKIHEK